MKKKYLKENKKCLQTLATVRQKRTTANNSTCFMCSYYAIAKSIRSYHSWYVHGFTRLYVFPKDLITAVSEMDFCTFVERMDCIAICSVWKKVSMMTSSNGNISRATGPFVRGIHRSPVNSPHKGQWRGALMFTLICTRTNDWVNNREAGDLRRHRGHYDVTVMIWSFGAAIVRLYTGWCLYEICTWFCHAFSYVIRTGFNI